MLLLPFAPMQIQLLYDQGEQTPNLMIKNVGTVELPRQSSACIQFLQAWRGRTRYSAGCSDLERQ